MINDVRLLKIRVKSHFRRTGTKKRIGFVRPRFGMYSLAMASTRLRVFDPVLWFEDDTQFIVELYNPRKTYDIVIFQKYFDDDAYVLAEQLKRKGVVIVLDINVNFFTSASEQITKVAREQAIRFTELADHVVAVSDALRGIIKKDFPNKPVEVIAEAIPKKFFKLRNALNNPPKTFIWMGYGWKVKELELLQNLLSELATEYGLRMVTIGGESVDLGAMDVTKLKYREWSVRRKMLRGDVFISPRDLSDPYNLTHAFTKIGVPMALGMPVVASPIPSYVGSPALLCGTEAEWRSTLTALACGDYDLNKIGTHCRNYAWKYYRSEKIKQDYKNFFTKVITT